MSERSTYNAAQKVIHWAVAVAVLFLLAVGFTLGLDALKPVKLWLKEAGVNGNWLYKYHKSFGVVVLGLMGLRVLAKVVFGAPPYAQPLAPWQRVASKATHHLLYMLLLAQPLLGWASTSAGGYPAEFFGWVLPAVLDKDKELAATLSSLHALGGFLLLALITLHIGAALMHGLILRDGVFSRMTR